MKVDEEIKVCMEMDRRKWCSILAENRRDYVKVKCKKINMHSNIMKKI